MSRVVTKEQDADRRGAYAATDCDACAAAACAPSMTPIGYTAWRRKHTTLPKKWPCTKAKRKAPERDPAPASSALLEREPYILWLQQALAKERAESNRLRRYLLAARGSLDKAIPRPKENQPGEPPAARQGAVRAPRPRPETGVFAAKRQSEDTEPGDDFDMSSPLGVHEAALLRAIHAKPDGRLSSSDAVHVMPKKSIHFAALRLKRRGHITIRTGFAAGENPGAVVYAITLSGRTALPPAEAPLVQAAAEG